MSASQNDQSNPTMPGDVPVGFIERWLNVLGMLSLGLILVLGILTYSLTRDVADASHRVDQTNTRLRLIEELRIGIQDAESGQRGYLLVHKPSYLDHYHNARGLALDQLEQLRVLSTGLPRQIMKLDALKTLLVAKFDEMADTLQLHDQKNPGAMLAAVATDEGKILMDRIRTLILDIEEDERAILVQNLAVQTRIAERTPIVAALALLLLGLLFAAAWASLSQEFKERRKLAHMLMESATRDALTGMINRREFERQLSHDWERKARYDSPLSLILIDIDHFKPVNDNYGHLAGDKILRDLAVRMQGRLRASEVLARYGGEEFVVLVPQPLSVAVFLAEQLRELVAEKPFEIQEDDHSRTIPLTISLGVADARDVASPRELIASADDAMYRAKQGGRNRVEVYQPDLSFGTTA